MWSKTQNGCKNMGTVAAAGGERVAAGHLSALVVWPESRREERSGHIFRHVGQCKHLFGGTSHFFITFTAPPQCSS